ncbi:Crp/Fnr family transcriptional regulator [Pseudomonas sp. H9]|uniref:Crp/Fnr family transcriptional regulator n=1 Tax=Pseudomonas sp. H9 TaxID=483968 RepID=UPI0010577B5B|nr:Crp/Fnr family transcriptional regulator [Pseudomonas sp. H9]TDF82345.1 Crp/Fnr family transcriptional regulator [Pseudomonas sp. H9]
MLSPRQLFTSCSWFDAVPVHVIEKLLEQTQVRYCEAGQCLYACGSQPEGIYGVLSGGFKISFTNREGDEAVVNVIGEGGWMGEVALFENAPYPASCYALRRSEALFLPQTTLLELAERWPVVYRNLLRDTCTKLKQVCWMSIQNKIQRPEQRLANRLYLLPEVQHTHVSDWLELPERLPHELLAQMLGLSRPRISQAMKALEQAGVLLGGHHKLKIHVTRLRLFCEGVEP